MQRYSRDYRHPLCTQIKTKFNKVLVRKHEKVESVRQDQTLEPMKRRPVRSWSSEENFEPSQKKSNSPYEINLNLFHGFFFLFCLLLPLKQALKG